MLESCYNTSIINLLIEKLSDNTETVILEALNSLQQMMEFLSIKAVIPCLSNLLVKLRPCFDISNHQVRTLGFSLFNRIISIVSVSVSDVSDLGYSDTDSNSHTDQAKIEEMIKEQVQLHLVSLLLHCNDEKVGVRNSCFKTLVKAGQVLLQQDLMCYMDQAKSEFADNYAKVYDHFLVSIVPLIVDKFPYRVRYYISNCVNHSLSSQESIRASSAYLIGVFYDCANKMHKQEVLDSINLEQVFSNFAKLLKDFSPKVKTKVAKSLTFFKHLKTE